MYSLRDCISMRAVLCCAVVVHSWESMEREASGYAKAREMAYFMPFLTYSYRLVRASVSLVCSDCVEEIHLCRCCAFACRLSAARSEVGSIIACHVMSNSSTV
jgi:hypothetical protein